MNSIAKDSIETIHEASALGLLIGLGSSAHRPIDVDLTPIHAPYFLLYSDSHWHQGSQYVVMNNSRIKINGFDNLIHPSNMSLLKEVDSSADSLIARNRFSSLPALSEEFPYRVLIDCAWASNYYHFNVDVIGKIMVASKFLDKNKCEFLLNCWKPFQREALDLLGINYRWIGYEDIFSGPIYVPSLPGASGAAPLETLLFIKSSFMAVGGERGTSPEFVYISRRRARRKIINEDQLCDELLKIAPFSFVDLEEMTLERQICTMRGARYVVGSHGAGLVNCLHMVRPCGIFEIFGNRYQAKMFRNMASQLGIRYAAYGEDSELLERGQASQWDSDYTVDATEIAIQFKMFIANDSC